MASKRDKSQPTSLVPDVVYQPGSLAVPPTDATSRNVEQIANKTYSDVIEQQAIGWKVDQAQKTYTELNERLRTRAIQTFESMGAQANQPRDSTSQHWVENYLDQDARLYAQNTLGFEHQAALDLRDIAHRPVHADPEPEPKGFWAKLLK